MPSDLFASAADARLRQSAPLVDRMRPGATESDVARFSPVPTPVVPMAASSYETRADVQGDGALTLTGLPFPAGTRVEVVVRAAEPKPFPPESYPLRGQPLRYDAPFQSAAGDDWDVLRDAS